MLSQSEKSHIKLVQKSVSDLTTINNSNIETILNKLHTTKGELLSDNYKICILRTLKKHNADITKKPHQLKLKSK